MKARQQLEHEVGACLRAGDLDAAVARVLRACGPGVLGYLRVALGDQSSAEHAYEAFSAAVWQKLRRQRGDTRLVVWAYRLAYRAAKQALAGSKPTRRAGSQRRAQTGPAALGRTQTAALGPLGLASDAELMRRELSLEEQTLLSLRLDRDFGWAEIGQVLGRGSGGEAEHLVSRRHERLVARLHRAAVARGLIVPGQPPANRSADCRRRSASRAG